MTGKAPVPTFDIQESALRASTVRFARELVTEAHDTTNCNLCAPHRLAVVTSTGTYRTVYTESDERERDVLLTSTPFASVSECATSIAKWSSALQLRIDERVWEFMNTQCGGVLASFLVLHAASGAGRSRHATAGWVAPMGDKLAHMSITPRAMRGRISQRELVDGGHPALRDHVAVPAYMYTPTLDLWFPADTGFVCDASYGIYVHPLWWDVLVCVPIVMWHTIAPIVGMHVESEYTDQRMYNQNTSQWRSAQKQQMMALDTHAGTTRMLYEYLLQNGRLQFALVCTKSLHTLFIQSDALNFVLTNTLKRATDEHDEAHTRVLAMRALKKVPAGVLKSAMWLEVHKEKWIAHIRAEMDALGKAREITAQYITGHIRGISRDGSAPMPSAPVAPVVYAHVASAPSVDASADSVAQQLARQIEITDTMSAQMDTMRKQIEMLMSVKTPADDDSGTDEDIPLPPAPPRKKIVLREARVQSEPLQRRNRDAREYMSARELPRVDDSALEGKHPDVHKRSTRSRGVSFGATLTAPPSAAGQHSELAMSAMKSTLPSFVMRSKTPPPASVTRSAKLTRHKSVGYFARDTATK